MTEIEAIRARHAVRNYTAKPLSPEIIDELSQEIEQCNRQGQLHIQLVTENEDAFKTFIPLFGRFKNVKNYIALAAKKQGDFYVKCGYCGARLMVKAQQAGLNSCWVTNTYNAKNVRLRWLLMRNWLVSLRLVTAPLTVRSISQKAWNVYVSHAVINGLQMA